MTGRFKNGRCFGLANDAFGWDVWLLAFVGYPLFLFFWE